VDLPAYRRTCPACAGPLWSAATAWRTVVTLEGPVRLHLHLRCCRNRDCPRYRVCLRPEQEGRFALPQLEFGLDVIALIGRLRDGEYLGIPEIHAELVRRGVPICVRSVGNLMRRYDELLTPSPLDAERLRRATAGAGLVVLAIDGFARDGDGGGGGLWILRDCLGGEVLLARVLRSSTGDELARLIGEVATALPVPILGVVCDGGEPIREAVRKALDGVPDQLPVPVAVTS
jgi:hypothetical protein